MKVNLRSAALDLLKGWKSLNLCHWHLGRSKCELLWLEFYQEGSGASQSGLELGCGIPPSVIGLGFGTCPEHQKESFNKWQPASKLEWKDNGCIV